MDIVIVFHLSPLLIVRTAAYCWLSSRESGGRDHGFIYVVVVGSDAVSSVEVLVAVWLLTVLWCTDRTNNTAVHTFTHSLFVMNYELQ